MLPMCPRHTAGQKWVHGQARVEAGRSAGSVPVCGAAACRHAVGAVMRVCLAQCSSCVTFHSGMRRTMHFSHALQHLSTGYCFLWTPSNTQQASYWSGRRDLPPNGAHANEPDSRMLGLPLVSAAAQIVARQAWQGSGSCLKLPDP